MSEPYGPPESRGPMHEADPPAAHTPIPPDARPSVPPEANAPVPPEARAPVPPEAHAPIPPEAHAPVPPEAHPMPGPSTPPPPRGADRVRARPGVPRWLVRLPYAFVLCGVAAGLAVVATNHFRRGSMLIAAAVFIGALARLLLPESQVGMLAVRRRWLDVLLMTAAAVGITLVAFVAKGTSG